jgi:methylmalonyl-CoA mutase
VAAVEPIWSTESLKNSQIEHLHRFQAARNPLGPKTLEQLKARARDRDNTFASLMDAVKYHSLGQISRARYEVGGEYHRNM